MELDLAQVQEALKLDKEKNDEEMSMSGYETHHVNYSLWTVPQRYRDLTRLGSGAYAQVCSAYDRKLDKVSLQNKGACLTVISRMWR